MAKKRWTLTKLRATKDHPYRRWPQRGDGFTGALGPITTGAISAGDWMSWPVTPAKHRRASIVGPLLDEFDEENRTPGCLRLGVYLTNAKSRSSSWTIRKKQDHPCVDAVYLFGGLPMGLQRRRHLLGAEQRRALEMLAATELNGCSGATLLGQGFRVAMLADLVGDGLATANRETKKAGKGRAAGVRIRITDAGRQALEG
jgi:hypothetical protein